MSFTPVRLFEFIPEVKTLCQNDHACLHVPWYILLSPGQVI